ncbi:MAG: metal ABC transporter permease [Spirochaetaceae bacterium]|jgi:zinc transport system permease protein|nr:metal ABC transporter permease [Spirochaetaceae bacterium]
MFQFTFLVRAFVVGALVSICAALLGVSLVLKRYSMIGDGLSHVGFGALAAATALNAAPLAVSIPIVVAAAFLLLRLSENSKIKGDAAIALISTASLAVGVVIISQTTGMNTDVCNYLFGSILAMNKDDVYLSIALSVTVLGLFIVFYNKLFAITFDETFAKASGVRVGMYNMLIAFLTAITIVLGMRMMGAMLISSLIIFPALSSMRLFKRFKSVTICSAVISILCFFIGIVISYLYASPTGASVVMINIAVFLLFWAVKIFFKEKKTLKTAAVFSVVGVLLLAACGNAKVGNAKNINSGEAQLEKSKIVKKININETIEIKEKMFIAQTNDVYLNPDEYLGKTIKLEGLFKREQFTGSKEDHCFVLRYGPGCCGSDGNAGFEVAWDKEAGIDKPYPAPDDWVEAVGTLKHYDEDGYPYLYLALAQINTLEERGAEFVSQ